MVKLSVIVVNYNVAYFLEQCLYSVKKAIQQLDIEVIIVDNNSVDGSVAMVKQKFPEFILIANKKNTGFSFANNQAIKISKGEYVLLLNPDTVVEEDTFSSVIHFMDNHPDAGGLGVKMIDGKGNFLPESKRGLPTPLVALFKISGLSALFSKSRLFGQYHLGYLDKDKVHQIDILSGAFMLMRKAALDKVGLLDEDFFMYGEDIDLSYRIIKGGYKNYYFPGTRIIHYKGESTKKSSVNYVFVFYKAMVIFARKHFSQQNAALFSFFIYFAIYLRAGAAILYRFIKKLVLPAIEAGITYTAFYLLVHYWESNVKYVEGGKYPDQFMSLVVPAYIIIWEISQWLCGGYDKPVKLDKNIKGIAIGTGVILIVYALVPDSLRFSRALILLGAVIAIATSIAIRLLLHFAKLKDYSLSGNKYKRLMIVGGYEESLRVSSLLEKTAITPSFVGFLKSSEEIINHEEHFLGTINQLKDSITIHKIDEIIFCAKDVSSQKIIELMSDLVQTEVDYKIAPPESLFLVGSNSINSAGDLYVIDINSIAKTNNRRNKRLLDLFMSLTFLVFLPFEILVVINKMGFIKNIFLVLLGIKSWVGYADTQQINPENEILKPLPIIKKGVLNPADGIAWNDNNNLQKINMLYSKDYSIFMDVKIIFSNFKKLGR